MHDGDEGSYQIGEDVEGTRKGNDPPKLATLYAEARRRRPELSMIDERAKALRRRSQAAAASTAPRLDLFANAYYANPNQRYVPQADEWRASWDVGVQLSWSPNDLPTSISSSRALDAKAAELESQKSDLEDAVLQEVRDAYFGVKQARAALNATKRALDAAEEAYRVRALQFRYGKVSAVALADSEAELLRARLERIDALIGLRVARVRLEHALGR
jgi:outer membrane protein TolC